MHIANHFAYLDAGTGSLIIQSLVGIVAGIGVFGRRVIANTVLKVKGLFGKDKPATVATPTSSTATANKVTTSKAKSSAKQ